MRFCVRLLPALLAFLPAAVACAAANLAVLPGVIAVAESQHRDRWGLDGWQPRLACDGRADTAWLSDNWEYTHTLALIFPQQVTVRELAVDCSEDKAPVRLLVRTFRDGVWQDLPLAGEPARSVPAAGRVRLTITLPPATVEVLAVSLPAGEAKPGADRRLDVRELEVTGEPVTPAVRCDTSALQAALAHSLAVLRQAEADRRVAPQLAVVMQHPKPSGFMSLIDRADLERGRKNIATRPWARHVSEAVVRDADWWVAQSDEYLYSLLPAGNPRAICPSFEKGCPLHGGARGSFTATLEKPFSWRCKQGGEEWCDGAVVKNPGTGQEVTVRDDGSGWLAPEGFPNAGRRYYFVAAYRYFVLGKLFSGPYEPDGGSKYQGGTPVVQLSLAYAFTGDRKYAHKAAVLLNRLAELYRFYDGGVEGPSQRQDGYIGNTFERFLAQNLIQCCDLIWDELPRDPELLSFFAARGNADYDGNGRSEGADLTYNLQRNLLGYIYEYLHRCMPYFDGDFLMYEMTALAALTACLNNADLADEMLNSDVGLRVLLTNSWFRDGKFIYDSTGYNLGNAQTPLQIAEWMQGFRCPPRYGQALDLYSDPTTNMRMLLSFLRSLDCDGRVPQIGDVGGSRTTTLNAAPPYSPYDERAFLRVPGEREYYRRRLQAASGGDLEGYRDGRADAWLVFHAGPAEAAGGAVAPPVPPSVVLDDGGIAILRAGRSASDRLHVPFTFSKGSYAHGHPDKLAINVFRYGWDLSADLGYPTTWTDLKNGGWETNTASHCTVRVDESGQRGNVIGNLRFFATEPACDVVEASAEGAYPQCSLYRRTVALVRDDRGEPLYIADLFRVAGGKTRDYLFHSLGKPEDLTVAVDGAEPPWRAQAAGSLAGEDVAPMSRGGYGFLWDVKRAGGGGLIRASWKPSTGMSQGDRYLLTRRSFSNCTVSFTMTRRGEAGGPQERAVFVFATDPARVSTRRVIMLPVDSLPVGKAVPVRIEVKGEQAQAYLAGQPVGKVDVTGAPGASGSVGFLHYYNYAFDYRDLTITPEGGAPLQPPANNPLSDTFWARCDPTYGAAGEVLRAGDAQPVQLVLTMAGAPGREVIRATGEGYGVRGSAPHEGHLIVRDRPDDPAAQSTYFAVIEATDAEPRVRKIEPVEVTADEPLEPGEVSAFIVESAEPGGGVRRDLIISSRSDRDDRGRSLLFNGKRVYFEGRFALLTERDGRFVGGMLAGGGELACESGRLELAGTCHAHVTAANAQTQAIAVTLSEGSSAPDASFIGRKLVVRNPGYGYVSVYTITKVEPLGRESYRLTLNLPLVVGRGVVGTTDGKAEGFASRTPVMKLRVNPGLFDGKVVRSSLTAKEWRLKAATEAAFVPQDRGALRDFPAGGAYVVCDVGTGDEVEVVPSGSVKY